MTIDTSYQDSLPFLFSGNAGSIRISASPNEAVPVTIKIQRTVAGGGNRPPTILYSTKFELKTGSNGALDLDLGKIFSAMEHVLPSASGQAATTISVRSSYSVSMRFGNENTILRSWTVIPGKPDDAFLEDIYGRRSFITARPQISTARTDGQPDWLLFIGGETTVVATIYSDMLPPVQLKSDSRTFANRPAKTDVSLDAVRKEADKAGLAGHRITAYDIHLESRVHDDDGNVTETVKSETLRFIVPDRKATVFEFVSSVGAMETVYATGRRKTELESEASSFTNGGVETELVNDWRFTHETFTGHLASADEVRFWREFFASSKRYAVVNGEPLRIAVTEIDAESTEGELGAFSFKWRFADRYADPARKTNRRELKQFRPKI